MTRRRKRIETPPYICDECGAIFEKYKGWRLHTMHHETGMDRFFSFVDLDEETGCWLWQGSLTGNGYGQFSYGHKNLRAHRWIYERLVGPIPKHLRDMDHLCRTPACVNPGHVEPVTHQENISRSPLVRGRRLSCPHCGFRTNAGNLAKHIDSKHAPEMAGVSQPSDIPGGTE